MSESPNWKAALKSRASRITNQEFSLMVSLGFYLMATLTGRRGPGRKCFKQLRFQNDNQ